MQRRSRERKRPGSRRPCWRSGPGMAEAPSAVDSGRIRLASNEGAASLPKGIAAARTVLDEQEPPLRKHESSTVPAEPIRIGDAARREIIAEVGPRGERGHRRDGRRASYWLRRWRNCDNGRRFVRNKLSNGRCGMTLRCRPNLIINRKAGAGDDLLRLRKLHFEVLLASLASTLVHKPGEDSLFGKAAIERPELVDALKCAGRSCSGVFVQISRPMVTRSRAATNFPPTLSKSRVLKDVHNSWPPVVLAIVTCR